MVRTATACEYDVNTLCIDAEDVELDMDSTVPPSELHTTRDSSSVQTPTQHPNPPAPSAPNIGKQMMEDDDPYNDNTPVTGRTYTRYLPSYH
jgi:hypothetical protein